MTFVFLNTHPFDVVLFCQDTEGNEQQLATLKNGQSYSHPSVIGSNCFVIKKESDKSVVPFTDSNIARSLDGMETIDDEVDVMETIDDEAFNDLFGFAETDFGKMQNIQLLIERVDNLIAIQKADPCLFTGNENELNMNYITEAIAPKLILMYQNENEKSRCIHMELFNILKSSVELSHEFPQTFRIFESDSTISTTSEFDKAVKDIYSQHESEKSFIALKKYLEWIKDGCCGDGKEIKNNFVLFKKLASYFHDKQCVETICKLDISNDSSIFSILRKLQMIGEYFKLLDASIYSGMEDFVKHLKSLRNQKLSHLSFQLLENPHFIFDDFGGFDNFKQKFADFLENLKNMSAQKPQLILKKPLPSENTKSLQEKDYFIQWFNNQKKEIANFKKQENSYLDELKKGELFRNKDKYKDKIAEIDKLEACKEKMVELIRQNQAKSNTIAIKHSIQKKKKEIVLDYLQNQDHWTYNVLPSAIEQTIENVIQNQHLITNKRQSFSLLLKELGEKLCLQNNSPYNWKGEPTMAESLLHGILGKDISLAYDKYKYRLKKIENYIKVIELLRQKMNITNDTFESITKQETSGFSKKAYQIYLFLQGTKIKKQFNHDIHLSNRITQFKEILANDSETRYAIEFIISTFYENFKMIQDWPELKGMDGFDQIRNYYNHLYIGGREEKLTSSVKSESNDINHQTAKEAYILSINVYFILQSLKNDLESVQYVKPDGNCMFNSVIGAMKDLTGKNDLELTDLRERVSKELNKDNVKKQVTVILNDKEFHGLGSLRETFENFRIDDDDMDILVEKYIENMKEDGVWGGHVELSVLAQMLQVDITVVNDDNTTTDINYEGTPDTKFGDIKLKFSGNHYSWIKK